VLFIVAPLTNLTPSLLLNQCAVEGRLRFTLPTLPFYSGEEFKTWLTNPTTGLVVRVNAGEFADLTAGTGAKSNNSGKLIVAALADATFRGVPGPSKADYPFLIAPRTLSPSEL